MTPVDQKNSELQVSRANAIVSTVNWALVVFAFLIAGLRVGSFSFGMWISALMFSTEAIRVIRILRTVGDRARNNDIVLYFREDAARKWFSVQDAVAGIVSIATSSTETGKQDAGPNA